MVSCMRYIRVARTASLKQRIDKGQGYCRMLKFLVQLMRVVEFKTQALYLNNRANPPISCSKSSFMKRRFLRPFSRRSGFLTALQKISKRYEQPEWRKRIGSANLIGRCPTKNC
jgi:hypothetical protein